MEKEHGWLPEIDDLNKISIEGIKLIFEQAGINLAELVKIYDDLKSKAYTLLSIYISIIGILVAFFGTKLSVGYKEEDKVMLIILSSALIPTIYCLIMIIRLIFPSKLMIAGRPPKELFVKKMIELPNNDQYLYLLFNECVHLQDKIYFNQKVNEKRFNLFKKVIIISVATFVIILILLMIFYFLF